MHHLSYDASFDKVLCHNAATLAMVTKICGIRIKMASKAMVVFESIITKLLLVISICSIVYSNNWLPVFINFSFLAFAIFALASYSWCYSKKQHVFVLPMLIYETVTIFWIIIWIYASLTAITTGYLWSLEWLGGPKSGTDPVSNDITHPNYADPNETHPETKKSIKYGLIITVLSLAILVLKIFAWYIAKRTFMDIRRQRISQTIDTSLPNNDSDIASESPPYPVVMRIDVKPKTLHRDNGDCREQEIILQNNVGKLPSGHQESYI